MKTIKSFTQYDFTIEMQCVNDELYSVTITQKGSQRVHCVRCSFERASELFDEWSCSVKNNVTQNNMDTITTTK